MFDRLFKCPTGQLTGVTIRTFDDVGAITHTKSLGKISYGRGHSLITNVNTDVTKRTLQQLGLKLEG